MTMTRGYHRCPAPSCVITIPDALFACFEHWNMLPRFIRLEIGRTSALSLLAVRRRRAIEAAVASWKGRI